MFFYVSGVLDPERFFKKLSALKKQSFFEQQTSKA